jgi:hypothetical protein
MKSYRVFFLDGVRLNGAENILAANDEEAVRRASDLAGVQTVEVWCGRRKLATINDPFPDSERLTAE